MASKIPNIRLRSDGRYEGRIVVSRPDGSRHRVSVCNPDKAECRAELARLRAIEERAESVPNDGVTVGELFTRWLAALEAGQIGRKRQRPATLQSYEELYRLHIKPGFERVSLRKLQSTAIDRMLRDEIRVELSPRRRHYILRVFRMALKQAMRWKLVRDNAALEVDPPPQVKHEVKPFSPDECRAFLASIRGHKHEHLFTVALALGVRQGELLALAWSDVDFKAVLLRIEHGLRWVKVSAAPVRWEPRREPTKTDRSKRTIPLPALAVAALKAQRKRQAAGGIVALDGYVFTDAKGQPFHARPIWANFVRAVKAAGLRPQRFHDLRHAAASLLLASGASLTEVASQLGHSSTALVASTYGHAFPEALRANARRMDRILGK